MASDAAAALARSIGADLPDSFAGLTDEQLRALDSMVHNAIDTRSRALSSGIEGGLKHVPALARPAVKKILGL